MCKKSAFFGHKKLKMTKLLMISLMFRRLKGTVFSRLQQKSISLALWTKAITCDKAGFKSRFCQVHQAGKIKIGVNRRNPRLINDLRLFMVLYNCRDTFTDVMSALQIGTFLTNKANFRKSQLDLTDLLTTKYVQMDT